MHPFELTKNILSSLWKKEKMTLARQRVLTSSEVRASDLEHGGSWVRIPSGAQIFSVSSYGWFFTSPFISFFINISGIGWLVGGSLVRHFLLLMWLCDTVKPYVLPVMDCVTARCGTQVQPTKMTLARQRVLSSSEVRASDLEHGGSWVRIPSGAQIFSVSS